jgi:Holliday junction resolvasome RuvABC ATP-dependent DNA helicase subunit
MCYCKHIELSSVETLAAAIGEEADIIGDVYELYLLHGGSIARTARGRAATQQMTAIGSPLN